MQNSGHQYTNNIASQSAFEKRLAISQN